MSPSPAAATKLVLASTSKYRRALLERLGLPFMVNGPMVDESAQPDENPIELVHRLSRAKAQAVAERFPQSVVIGSDQVAVRGRVVLGKPGTVERCVEQLQDASGQRVIFYTGVHVIDGKNRRHEAHVDTTTVFFRALSDAEIKNYIAKDQPLDCAGGFKAESLGIALFDRIDSQDPTALTGLPLIWVSAALRRAGFDLP
jgi:septum formation protein